ncbi:Serine/threonine-protein kinase HipA [compost metagenome]|uniref:type II toxin-antitoxin system HipA family toxin n=1 Tax=Aeromonas hydrophila TaxID=644 RepID=UPI000FB0EFD7|nr:type II toxin-antitoxin system HipA family toxin [Aeromonas hydrophila]
MVMEVVEVNYHGQRVGAVSYDTERRSSAFEYDETFIKTGIQLSPIMMPLAKRIYTFPALGYDTFKGLPGLLADSLPDDFGNAVLNAWVAAQGKSTDAITPLQRLQYTGLRGMGALEYRPASNTNRLDSAHEVSITSLVSIAQGVLDERNEFELALKEDGQEDRDGMLELLSVGMSAGGARPKAVLAFNESFTEARSGQAQVPEGFTHYLMKFDGVSEHNKNRETFGDPLGFGAMEYVYHLMAKACGIEMMPCRLLDEGNRRHFLTQRFDRRGNTKIHVQTLNGMAHIDYKQHGSYSYEQLFGVVRKLKLSAAEAEQLLLRMVFNIVARNHDDHAKNFAFLLDGTKWKLAPAYDIAYSYKPGSQWVGSHWMRFNGKQDNFTRTDFHQLEQVSHIFTPDKLNEVIEKVTEQVSQWPALAKENGVPQALISEVQNNLRLNL